jgi:hypothetical protein
VNVACGSLTGNVPLIGLAGRAGTGKTTAARLLREQHGFVEVALAAPLRAGLKAMFGLHDIQLTDAGLKEHPVDWLYAMTPRRLMQTLGTEWGQHHIGRHVWIRAAERRIAHLLSLPDHWHVAGIVISDLRYDHEAAWLRAQGGTVWHLLRAAPRPPPAHDSEDGITPQAGDRSLDNTAGPDTLETNIGRLVEACLARGAT